MSIPNPQLDCVFCKLNNAKERPTNPKVQLPKEIKYLLVDIHGVLTDGQERKRFLEQMSTDYGMDYEKHNSLWANHIEALDVGQETATEYLTLVNNTFHTQISV